MKTSHPNKSIITRQWHLVDAKDQILGRLATNVARTLIGKAKRHFSPHVDCGDYVVVINAESVKITGNSKPTQKIDFRHSGYPGGHTMTPYNVFMEKKPEHAISLAVTGMLPKNRLRKRQIQRLKVFRGSVHPHTSQFVKPAAAATPLQENKVG